MLLVFHLNVDLVFLSLSLGWSSNFGVGSKMIELRWCDGERDYGGGKCMGERDREMHQVSNYRRNDIC